VIDMSIPSRTDKPDWLYFLLAIVAMLAMTVSVPAKAATGDVDTPSSEPRSSKSLHIRSGGRANRESGTTTLDTYAGLDSSGTRVKPSAKSGSGMSQSESPRSDFWIYDADVILFADDDRDGYFYGIDLLFDADTIYGSADVYAAVYLSLEGGPWNEYAVTEDFTIFGASSDDEYVLVTELMSGYPTGSYDLLIELFDAFDGTFLASLGPEDTSELAYLPLEDFDRDEPLGGGPVIIVDHGGGGATGIWLLLPLAFAALRRRIPGLA
jgi:hypothetical protein